MTGKENPATVKARNARRRPKLRENNAVWSEQNREKENARKLKSYHAHKGDMAELVERAFKPLSFESDNCLVTSDWHIPFHDESLVKTLLEVASENETTDLAITGDLWDANSVSSFNSILTSNSPEKITFQGECEHVAKMLKRLLNAFKYIYICRGNHEYRWTTMTMSCSGTIDLYKMAMPSIFEGGKYYGRVLITNDDHMYLTQSGQKWLLCHPRSFRQTPLSVVRDLAAIYGCNVIGGHGHQFTQGRDKSGKYICLDGGGLFDKDALEYLRTTSTHPRVRSGFYLLKNGTYTAYEGK